MPISFSDILLIISAPFIGSFMGLVAHRLPRKEGFIFGRSRCVLCGFQLTWRDLLPIVSWLSTRGRCRYCGESIDATYPVVEAGAVVIAIWSVATPSGYSPWLPALIGWVLLLLAAIDYRTWLLPDYLTLPLIASGLVFAWLTDENNLSDHVVGAVAGFSSLAAIALIYRRLRNLDGLGLGDAKLFSAAGAWVSWQGLPTVLLVASVGGLLFVGGTALWLRPRMTNRTVPFGPFLALGFWSVLLYGPIRLY